MKVTIYLDGKHNSIEVKDKIWSVLPETYYMIFDAGEPIDKMTKFQQIKAMGLEEMAELLDDVHSDGFNQGLSADGTRYHRDTSNYDKQWLESEVETE